MPHARAAKILTGGVTTSMVLGIITYMAHSANVEAAASAREAKQLETSQIVAAKLFRPPDPVPTTVAPTVPPAGGVPQVVPVPVPATPAPATTQPAPPQPASTSHSSK